MGVHRRIGRLVPLRLLADRVRPRRRIGRLAPLRLARRRGGQGEAEGEA